MLARVLPSVGSVQSLERLGSVEALPLFDTAPVVNLFIFYLLQLKSVTIVCRHQMRKY